MQRPRGLRNSVGGPTREIVPVLPVAGRLLHLQVQPVGGHGMGRRPHPRSARSRGPAPRAGDEPVLDTRAARHQRLVEAATRSPPPSGCSGSSRQGAHSPPIPPARHRDAAPSARYAASARMAIFLASQMPPARPSAGCRMRAPWARAARIPPWWSAARRSPRGCEVARATSASAGKLSGGTGSSNHSGSEGSIALASRIAPPGMNWPWVPNRRSAASPTAARIAAQKAADRRDIPPPRHMPAADRVGAGRVELHRRPALGHARRRRLRLPSSGRGPEPVGVVMGLGVKVGVGPHAVVHPPAQKRPDRHARAPCPGCPSTPFPAPKMRPSPSGSGRCVKPEE
jgi:hypothetical protein